MSAKVIPFRLVTQKPVPTLRELTDRVHRLAKEDPDCIAYSVHVKERMSLRGKTMRDILETLQKGEGVKGPTIDEYGDFRIKLRRVCIWKACPGCCSRSREGFLRCYGNLMRG